MNLSDTAQTLLNAAAQRDDRLVPRRAMAPPVADLNVCRALVKQGLVEIVRAPVDTSDVVTIRENDGTMAFVIADAGFRAIDRDPPSGGDPGATDGPTGPQALDAEAQVTAAAPEAANIALVADTTHVTLRRAAAAVLTAWDDQAHHITNVGVLEAPMAVLRNLLARHAPRRSTASAPRRPREGTKQAAVLAMLRRPEGATVTQVMQATGWASHTVRGLFAGLKTKGINVQVLERVRQVGPNQTGSKGSYTVYGITAAVAAQAQG